MSIQPKIELGSSSSTNHVIVFREEETVETQNLEVKSIPDLVEVLRRAYKLEDFDKVESVLVSRDVQLRNQIQHLHHNIEMEKQKLQDELEMEKLARLQADEDFKLREEICKKMKILEERYEDLLKKVKVDALDADGGTIAILRERNIELREMCENGKREKESCEARLKEAEKTSLAARGTIGELKKKNVALECQVKKLKEDGNVDVLRRKNGALELQILALNEKRVEDDNFVDVLRKKNDELEHRVLELNKKKMEDNNALDVLKAKNTELEHEVLELKEKRVGDDNALDVVKAKNCELESEVLELRKLKGKWVVDSKTVDVLRSKVRVLENDKNALAGIQIENVKLKEKVNNNLATISELRREKIKLADKKIMVEALLESLSTKFKGLDERVARLQDDSKVLMSVDTSGGGNNEGKPPADTMVVDPVERDEEDVCDCQLENDPVEEVAASPQVQNSGGKEALLESEAKVAPSDDENVDRCVSREVHGKKAISGIAMKNGHPTPCSLIAGQQMAKFKNEVDMVKRKLSLSDSESSTSSSSVDLWCLDNLIQAKKKKM